MAAADSPSPPPDLGTPPSGRADRPLGTWPEDLLQAVGRGYRAAGAEGEAVRLAGAVDACLAAGGDAAAAAVVVPEMIRGLDHPPRREG